MDVKRTFNKPQYYPEETRQALRQQLRRVLLAYSNFDPDCGYIQGKFLGLIWGRHEFYRWVDFGTLPQGKRYPENGLGWLWEWDWDGGEEIGFE